MALWNTIWGTAPDPATGMGGSGLLGNADYIGDIGFGLLANSGPSLQPHSFGSSLGRAGMYASERRDQSLMNDLRRQSVVQAQRELQGQKDLAEYIAGGGKVDLNTMLRFMPGDTAKGIAAAYADPTVGTRMEAAAAALPGAQAESELKQAELSSAKADIGGLYESASKASDAAEYLKSIPGGESIATVSDDTLKQLRKAKANNWDKSFLGDVAANYLTQIPRDQWGTALDAAEQLQKARNSIATLSSAANRAGASGLQAKLTGLGEGAGLNLQSDLFQSAVEKSARAAEGFSGYKLPEVDSKKFSWRQGVAPVAETGLKPPTVGGIGYQNGALRPQPAPVYGDPAAAPPITPSEPLPGVAAPAPGGQPGDIPYVSDWMSSLKGLFAGAPQTPLRPPTVAPAAGGPPPVAAPQPMRLGPAAPAPRKVPTVSIDPATGNPMRPFPRKADGERATPKGQKFIAPDPKTGEPMVWQN